MNALELDNLLLGERVYKDAREDGHDHEQAKWIAQDAIRAHNETRTQNWLESLGR